MNDEEQIMIENVRDTGKALRESTNDPRMQAFVASLEAVAEYLLDRDYREPTTPNAEQPPSQPS